MNILKTIGNVCLVLLAVISVCVSIAFGYYHFFVKDVTVGINNISDQLAVDIKKNDELTSEEKDMYAERWFMEANYYSNDKKNGIELQELNYNYFTGFELTQNEYRSSGMQYLGDFVAYNYTALNENLANNSVLSEFNYYDTTDGISFDGYNGKFGSVNTTLNRNEQFIIKIDNKPYLIQLTGSYDTYKKFLFIKYKEKTTYYDYGDVFATVFNAIKKSNKGYGDFYIRLDLSQYFTIRGYNEKTGKFDLDNVTDIIKSYAVLKFHYDENGAIKSNQSMFGMIDCNRNYGMEDENIDTTYWQERMLYNLNENSKIAGKSIFEYRYSDIYNGSFLSLTMDGKKLFSEMARAKINVVIDLESDILKDKKVVGLDYNAFENIEIDTLTIKGSKQVFYMLDKSLYNTKLQTLEYSNGITFDMAENSLNNEYKGVVL